MTAEHLPEGSIEDWYLGQSERPLVFSVTSPKGAGYGLSAVLPCVKFNGEIAKSNSGSPVALSAPFDVLDNDGALPPLTVYYGSADTAP